MKTNQRFLDSILEYAVRETPYYRDRKNFYTQEFQNIPIINANILQNNYGDFISDSYKKYPKIQNVYIGRALEADGSMFKMIWDNDDYEKMNSFIWKIRNEYYGIVPDDKWCSFYTALYRSNMIIDEYDFHITDDAKGLLINVFNLNDVKLKEICQHINLHNPKWIKMPSSVAKIIAHYFIKEKITFPDSVKYIELIGEIITDNDKIEMERVFKIKPVILYSLSTVGGIAISHECGSMHLIKNNLLIETLRDGKSVVGEEGDICVTGFNNYAMPIIRYKTSERGILYNDNCNSNELSLKIIKGRDCVVLDLGNGERYSQYSLLGAIVFTNECMCNAVKSFRYEQISTGVFKAYIKLKPAFITWQQAVKESFIKNIREDSLKEAKWEFIFE